MPVSFYVGVPGSGKTYSIVKEVVLPAVEQGRRIVSNIEGLSEEKIHAYLKKHTKTDPATFGKVITVNIDQAKANNFVPHEGFEEETIVKGGDLLVMDEAQMFWGYGDKLSAVHLEFLTTHRHYVDEVSKRSCDVVLATQDLRLINRKALGVVGDVFKVERRDEIGLDKVFVLYHYRGSATTQKNLVQTIGPNKFDPEMFPLYESFKGGLGVVARVDKNANLLRSKKVVIGGVVVVLLALYSVTSLIEVFSAPEEPKKGEKTAGKGGAPTPTQSPAHGAAQAAPKPSDESDWRVVGHYTRDAQVFIQLRRGDAFRTLIAPKGFYIDSLRAYGQLDGKQVANWTGEMKAEGGFFGGVKR